ncbi:MAG TPA: response regulator [Longimicrobiales bacterium]|nr:response regulator [Longimicrobiales bacterium]
MTILLVDDDPLIRLAAGHALGAAGHTLLEAEDVGSAVGLARTSRIDLMLLDVVLDGEDGRDVVAAVRALPGCADTRFVFLTGRADAEREALLSLGAAGVIAKPFDLSTLASQVERLALQ